MAENKAFGLQKLILDYAMFRIWKAVAAHFHSEGEFVKRLRAEPL